MIDWLKRLFRRKPQGHLTVAQIEEIMAKATILQREAMHEAYFSHQPFIDWLEKRKQDAPL